MERRKVLSASAVGVAEPADRAREDFGSSTVAGSRTVPDIARPVLPIAHAVTAPDMQVD